MGIGEIRLGDAKEGYMWYSGGLWSRDRNGAVQYCCCSAWCDRWTEGQLHVEGQGRRARDGGQPACATPGQHEMRC